jgi:hypothetical protein
MKHLPATIGVLGVILPSVFAGEPESSRPEFREIGDRVAAALFGNLGETLQKQIAQNGVEAAIPFCKAAALPLTAGTAEKFEGVQSVRRIGVRTRNPDNLPDAADRAILEELLQNWSREVPQQTGLLREVKTDSGETEWRYYRPITLTVTCLACHGTPQLISPSVLTAIRKIYPEDQAIDFQEGDLRGAVVVTFPQGASPVPK